MMPRQDQTVSEDGEAYQAGRDITVHKGLTPEQMSEIMVAMAAQLGTYFAKAEATASQRVNDLRHEILAEFGSRDTDANSEAFLDPDYQFVVQGAQQSFARNGDEWLKKELVRLLAVRSRQESGSRKAMILNEAISIAGNLTKEEYSALVVGFIMKQVKVSRGSVDEIFDTLNSWLEPFVNDLPQDNHAYDYLESMRCVSINLITGVEFWDVITKTYRMELSQGFSLESLNNVLAVNGGARNVGRILVAVGDSQARFVAPDRTALEASLASMGFPAEGVRMLLKLHDTGLMSPDAIKSYVRARAPALASAESRWSTTKLHQSVHTALGKALAHSALVSRTGFDGELEEWVR